MPYKEGVPQNPKAERHLRLREAALETMSISACSPEPKSRKAFETYTAAILALFFSLRSPEPKSRKAFETRWQEGVIPDCHLSSSPEPKSRKAFETSILLFRFQSCNGGFPRTQKPKGI